jgi:hypothetical integral membrane protein (TIGR02206 family)
MSIFFDQKYAQDFQLFGWLHILVLLLGAGSMTGLYLLRETLKKPLVGAVFRYTVATLLLAGEISYHVWLQTLGQFRWLDAIPLGLCDMCNWITLVALFFDLDRVIKVILPWALSGATLSFIVVDMGTSYTFPHFRFFHYFGNHWLFLAGNLYYLFTGRFRYGYKDLLKSTGWLSVVCVGVLAFDLATNTDNMFLRAWPEELDFVNKIGFPLNTVALVAGIFLLFNIFYALVIRRRYIVDAAPAPEGLTPVAATVAAGS